MVANRHPDGNTFIERMFRSLKEEAVWPNEFDSYDEALEAILAWMFHYNTQRPHAALGQQTPAEARAEAAHKTHGWRRDIVMPRQYPPASCQELVDRMLARESVLSLVSEYGFLSRRWTGGSAKRSWMPD